MSKHHNSKTQPVANGAGSIAVADGNQVHGQTPFARENGRDVETARLAYSYWEARGRGHGSADTDWVRAEREIKALRL